MHAKQNRTEQNKTEGAETYVLSHNLNESLWRRMRKVRRHETGGNIVMKYRYDKTC